MTDYVALLRVPKVIAYEAGVLITVAVTAPSLSAELLRGSQRPDELLSRVADTARHLQRALGNGHPALAKLVSRTVLLVTTPPARDRTSAILDALDQLLAEFLRHHAPAETHMLRRLLALWLADWSNYLATGLSLPPGVLLPLPPTLLTAAARARALLLVATDVAAHLVTNPDQAWYLARQGCHQLARDMN